MEIVALMCLAWWLISLAIHVGSAILAALRPSLQRRSMRREQPPVSIIIPVRQDEPGLEAALESVFVQSYPRFEILVSATEKTSPALDVARRVQARFPDARCQIVCSEIHGVASPKLNNLITPIAIAAYDMIFIVDSNVRLHKTQLAEAIDQLENGVGLVAAATVGCQPASFAADIECAFLNGYHARYLLAAAVLGWGFGNGKILLFDRRNFQKAGGVAAIAGSVAEDHALSKALARIGRKTVMATAPATQFLGRRSFQQIWTRQLRWMVCRRIEAPWAFYLEPFLAGLATAAAGAVAAPMLNVSPWLLAGATLALWFLCEAGFLTQKGWLERPSAPAAWICRELLVPVLWCVALCTTVVSWNGIKLDARQEMVQRRQSR